MATFQDFTKPQYTEAQINEMYINKIETVKIRCEMWDKLILDILGNNKNDCEKLYNGFKTLESENTNKCFKNHNKILDFCKVLGDARSEGNKKFFTAKIRDLFIDYYNKTYNYPMYIKALISLNEVKLYTEIYNYEIFNEKELRNILFQLYFN